jgi:hypothetical protein
MRIAALAVMALFSAPAHAALYQVDLSTMTPTGALYGPCYCGFGPLYPVMHFNPGDTVDFGSITLPSVFDFHSFGRDPFPMNSDRKLSYRCRRMDDFGVFGKSRFAEESIWSTKRGR